MLKIFNSKIQYSLIIFSTIVVIFPITLFFCVIFFDFIKKNRFIFLRVFLSCYLSFINTNKFLESDLLGYSISYENSRLYGYIGAISKEPLYFIFELIFSKLNLPFSFFLFFITFSCYMLLYKAALNFADKNKFFDALFLILLITFSFNIFNLSAHLVRQFIAMSVFVFAVSLQSRKKLISLSFIAFFFHSSMVLFIPLIYLKPLHKKLTLNTTLLLLFGTGFMLIVGNYVLIILSNIPFLDYVINRSINDSDSFTTNESIGLNGFLFLFFTMFFNILCQLYYRKKEENFLFFNIISFIVVFIIVAGTFNNLLAYRYLFYLYLFLPYLLFKLLLIFKNYQILSIFKFLIIVSLVFMFFFKIKNGVWDFGPMQNILLIFY